MWPGATVNMPRKHLDPVLQGEREEQGSWIAIWKKWSFIHFEKGFPNNLAKLIISISNLKLFQPGTNLLKLKCYVLCWRERQQVPGNGRKCRRWYWSVVKIFNWCCFWDTSNHWKKHSMKLNFFSNIFLFRWTRWFPVELWSLNTLRPRESPTSSTSTGVSITMATIMAIYGHMGHNGIEFSTNSSNPQESHPCWGEVLGREPQRSLQPQAGAGCHVWWHKRNISTSGDGPFLRVGGEDELGRWTGSQGTGALLLVRGILQRGAIGTPGPFYNILFLLQYKDFPS